MLIKIFFHKTWVPLTLKFFDTNTMSSASDDIVWQVINHQFCAFKLTTAKKESFCRNEYNVSGVCSRHTCPLANSRYATVRNVDGRIYLYIKTPERAHMPRRWWERIKLSRNHEESLAQIDAQLAYWPASVIDRCKQRLTRLSQVASAERRLALKHYERHYTSTAPKVKRRETVRERKALVAAKLERAIEKELLDRLKSGAYGEEPLNVDERVWKKVMESVHQDAEEVESESVDENEVDSEEEREFVEDDDEIADLEDLERWLGDPSLPRSDEESEFSSSDDNDSENDKPRPKRRRGAHVEIEYENDTAVQAQQ